MKRSDKTLSEEFSDYVARRSDDNREHCRASDRDDRRHIARLATRGVTTASELIAAFPELPPKLKRFGISWLQWHHESRAAETTLSRMLYDDPKFRLSCASALCRLTLSQRRRRRCQRSQSGCTCRGGERWHLRLRRWLRVKRKIAMGDRPDAALIHDGLELW